MKISKVLLTALPVSLLACGPRADPRVDDALAKISEIEQKIARLEKAKPERAQKARPSGRLDESAVYNVPVRDTDAHLGAQHAKVTLTVAHEFACPYCARLEPVFESLLERYPGDTTLKIVPRQFVVHPNVATDAALAVCAAHQQSKFAEYQGALWKAAWPGGRLNRDQLSRARLIELGRELGLDGGRMRRDMTGATCKSALKADERSLARLGVRGTPTIFVNGKPYYGPRTADALAKRVDAEAKSADRAIQQGASLRTYYTQLVAEGKTSP